MGWLSNIAKIAAVGGAPFTGGASLAALPAISALGQVAGGAAKGAAADRLAQQNAAADNYRTQQGAATNLLGQRESAVRDRADRTMNAPAQRSKQAVIASMLRGYKPQSVSGLPAGVSVPQTSGGGLSALMSSPQAKQSLDALIRQALMAQLSGSDVPELPDTKGAMLTPPSFQKAGKMESILSGIGLAAGGIGALGPMLKKKPPVSDYPGQYGGG